MIKKILLISLVLLLGLLSLTACEAKNEISKASNDSAELSTEASITQKTDTSSGITSTEQSDSQSSSNGNGATILVQSKNAITDTEKQKILDELNTEIDNLINSINALDDVQGSDLTFE